jgi:hypothetical protein
METMFRKGHKGWSIPVFLVALLVWTMGTGFYMGLPSNAAAAEKAAGGDPTFDFVGHIDRVGEDELVIDDRLMKFSDSTKYFSQTNGKAYRSHFRKGIKVRYNINDNKEITAIGLVGD